MPHILSLGWTALSPWPNAFHAYLDQLRLGVPAHQSASLHGAYAGLTKRLLNTSGAENWPQVLLQEIARHAAANSRGVATLPSLKKVLPQEALDEMPMTAVAAAKELGIAPDTLGHMAKRLGLGTKRDGQRKLFSREDIERIKAAQEARMTGSEACDFLGISLPTVKALVAAGVLTRAPDEDCVYSRRRRLSAQQVHGILSAFEAALAEGCISTPPSTRLMAIHGGPDRRGANTVRICQAVLAGRLRPVRADQSRKGLWRFLFRAEDVFAALVEA
jgi:DNA-binding transcriptional MerR regulator